MTDELDVAIIGAGPGGYTAAERCAANGLSTVLVESRDVGGTCLNIGCIPSKALIHAADRFAELGERGDLAGLGIASTGTVDLAATMRWKDSVVSRLRDGVTSMLAAAGVTTMTGTARVIDGKTIEVQTAGGVSRVRARNLVLATGSRPLELPGLPFGGAVVSSTEALALEAVPEHVAVVGAGYIGLELGTALRKLGANVTVVEMTAQILPMYDAALVRPIAKRLAALGIDVCLQSVARELGPKGLDVSPADQAGDATIVPADVVLVAVGRLPATDGWGLEVLDLTMAGRFVAVDEQCRTSMRGVYAIGDLTGEPMLAHRAMAQATLVADVIAGASRRWDHLAVPAVCFTDPELLSVGLSPDDAKQQGVEVTAGLAPLTANGRALTLGRDDGFVRVVARTTDGVVVGIQAVGAGVSELSSAAATAIEMGATAADLELTMHAHPTLGESIHDAASRAARRLRRA